MNDTVAEKKPRTGDNGDGCDGEPSGTAESGGGGLVERLPEALLVEVLGRLDVDDACSAVASCCSLHAAPTRPSMPSPPSTSPCAPPSVCLFACCPPGGAADTGDGVGGLVVRTRRSCCLS